jgi:mono/diheme cytochrome c family protein
MKLNSRLFSHPFRPLVIALAVGGLLLTACGTDLKVQLRYDPLEASSQFADGRSARPLPAGAVPQATRLPSDPFNTGKTASGDLVDELPVPRTMETLERGQQRFEIYCAPCHGLDGSGKGSVTAFGFSPPPPSFHTEDVYKQPLGFYYDVITNGRGRMFSYAYRLEPADRWAVVAYIRALQLSQNTPADSLTPQQRQELDKQP